MKAIDRYVRDETDRSLTTMVEPVRSPRSLTHALLLGLTLCLLVFTCVADRASAEFAITSADGALSNDDGTAVTQAASHPYVAMTTFALAKSGAPGAETVNGSLKDLHVNLPPGLIGNPTAVARCTNHDLSFDPTNPGCSGATQVGVADIGVLYLGSPLNGFGIDGLPVFNMVPPPGVAATLAFNVVGQIVRLNARVRADGQYATTIDVKDASQGLALTGTTLRLWGVPADPRHDAERWDPNKYGPGFPGYGAASSVPPVPFMTLPTSCAGPQTVTFSADSWQNPGVFSTASFVSHDEHGTPVGADGCDRVPFTPSVDVTSTSSAPDAPTGLDVDLVSPQHLNNPDGLASAHLKDVKVTLPEGMTINPAAADGLQACSDEQLGLGSDRPASCPDAAKIGSVTADTPLLEEPLEGDVYVRSQASGDPESGDMFRMALVLANPDRGVVVKLPGAIQVNKDSGRIVTMFKNNPQLPVERISLHLKGGDRAPLATPPTCGAKTVDTELTSWAGQDVTLHDGFDIACGAGLGGFAPSVTAGAKLPVGGAFSPFALSIAKPDRNAPLTGLSLSLPAGLLAKLKDNVGTQVGTVIAFAGPGASPFALPGKVFLEGRYGDAPFSLRVVVPAKAGPFDLGTVEVRQRIYVDPIDAHVTVVSDPLPTIVKGVPVRLQRVDVDVDKPGFMINPTSCAAQAIGGTLSAVDGQTAPINVRFQVGDCASLALKPALGLTLSGKGQTTDGGHPAVSAVLSQPTGQANLRKVRVTLPLSLALDPDNAASGGLCSFVEGSKPDPKCPASSVVGKATAVSPILNEPLTGPVYFVKNERKDAKSGRSIKTTPKLVIPLVGENGVKFTLTGVSTVVDDQLVTTFDNIPDAPVSSFKMDINGGKKGILVVSNADICKSTQIAEQQVDGQNNKQADTSVYIQTPSCPIKIISKKITAKTVMLKVGGLGAGRVTVSGGGIRKTTKTIAKSTVATITAKRTKGRPARIKVSFVPAGALKAKTTTTTLSPRR